MKKIQEISCLASSMSSEFSLITAKINIHLDGIENLQKSLTGLEDQLHEMIQSDDFPAASRRQKTQ
ncbi:hypothetical protein [Dehalobacterium formicoaceticum]|uniref:hypothetical protein n=1 Tax=Dehalobacterium formicoaceticum TaxID=51515 RepID=UPI0031F5F488